MRATRWSSTATNAAMSARFGPSGTRARLDGRARPRSAQGAAATHRRTGPVPQQDRVGELLLDALGLRIKLIGGAGRSRIEEHEVRKDQAGDPTEGLTDRRRNVGTFTPPGASPAALVAGNRFPRCHRPRSRWHARPPHVVQYERGSGGDHRKDRRSRSVEGGRLDAPSVAALRS